MFLQGFTPLMHAAQNGNLKMIKLLLAAGANAQAANTHVSQLRAVIRSVRECVLYSVMDTLLWCFHSPANETTVTEMPLCDS